VFGGACTDAVSVMARRRPRALKTDCRAMPHIVGGGGGTGGTCGNLLAAQWDGRPLPDMAKSAPNKPAYTRYVLEAIVLCVSPWARNDPSLDSAQSRAHRMPTQICHQGLPWQL